MAAVAAYCVTAIVVALIIAGGINRAAFYFSTAIISYLANKHMKDEKEKEVNDDVEIRPL